MKRQAISERAHSAAEPPAVYGLLRDGASWPTWSPLGSFELEQPAPEGGEGIGAIRVFRTRRVTSREWIAELVPDRRFGHELLSGLPVRDSRAAVDLQPWSRVAPTSTGTRASSRRCRGRAGSSVEAWVASSRGVFTVSRPTRRERPCLTDLGPH